jgi:hypothetical protein
MPPRLRVNNQIRTKDSSQRARLAPNSTNANALLATAQMHTDSVRRCHWLRPKSGKLRPVRSSGCFATVQSTVACRPFRICPTNSDGRRAYVACTPDDYVAMIDLKSLEVAGHIEAGKQPDGLAWAVSR